MQRIVMFAMVPLVSIFIISLSSYIGLLALFFGDQALQKSISHFVSFASGALLANAMFGFLPKASHAATSVLEMFGGIAIGFLLFFILDAGTQHCKDFQACAHKKMHSLMTFAGQESSNLFFGGIVMTSFLISLPLGITTTLALALHKGYTELVWFRMLLDARFSIQQALYIKTISIIFPCIGAIIVFMLHSLVPSSTIIFYSGMLLASIVGSFIYAAGRSFLPNVKAHALQNFIEYLFLFAGIGTIVAVMAYSI